MRKPSQRDKLRKLLSDGKKHSTPEILREVYGGDHKGIARIASRVHELRKEGREIACETDPENPSISHYQMTVKPKPKVEYVMKDGVMYARLVPQQ